MDRLEGMRQCRLGNGETECILCGETFRFYHRSQRRCAECKMMTCSKCGGESVVKAAVAGAGADEPNGGQRKGSAGSSTLSSSTSVTSLLSMSAMGAFGVGPGSSADGKETIWLCKICGEQREMWKKSGAWFFKVRHFDLHTQLL